jgi:hypothetical protein
MGEKLWQPKAIRLLGESSEAAHKQDGKKNELRKRLKGSGG